MILKPAADEYDAYYSGYIALVPETDVLAVLGEQLHELPQIATYIPPDRERFRYADGKWSIREVFGHLIDAERVFGYRAFCISRGETALLPRFDEDTYVAKSGYDSRTLADLIVEFESVRSGNLSFMSHLDERAWARTGSANNKLISVRALAFIMAGHIRHHVHMLGTRYGVAPQDRN